MTHTRHVTPGPTAARIQNVRSLIIILLDRRQVLRDELGGILKVGPSGVRKHLKDLRGKVELTIIAGDMVCRLAMSDEAARGLPDRAGDASSGQAPAGASIGIRPRKAGPEAALPYCPGR